MSDRLYIFDTTLRDGEQVPGCQLNTVEKIEVARALEALGVDIIEAGFPITSEGDFEAVRAISRTVKRAEVAALARANPQDIDRAWMVFAGMKQGPFGIMDLVGLDVVYDIEMSYYNESKDPKDIPPKALKDKIEKKELGVKTGKGFYTYPNPEYAKPDFLKP